MQFNFIVFKIDIINFGWHEITSNIIQLLLSDKYVLNL